MTWATPGRHPWGLGHARYGQSTQECAPRRWVHEVHKMRRARLPHVFLVQGHMDVPRGGREPDPHINAGLGWRTGPTLRIWERADWSLHSSLHKHPFLPSCLALFQERSVSRVPGTLPSFLFRPANAVVYTEDNQSKYMSNTNHAPPPMVQVATTPCCLPPALSCAAAATPMCHLTDPMPWMPAPNACHHEELVPGGK